MRYGFALMRMVIAGEGEPKQDDQKVDDQKAQAPGWVAQLPADLKGDEAFTKFQTLGDFAKGYKETTGKVAELDGKLKGMVPRLPEKATPDDLKAYRAAMGIPETPDKYDLKRAEWPEDRFGPYPEKDEKAFREFAHQANLTPAQVQAAYDWYLGNILNAGKSFEAMTEERRVKAVDALKKEWGDKYQENAQLATKAFWYFANEDDMKWFEGSGLGDNPAIIRVFHNIGLRLMDDRMVRDVKPPGSAGSQQPVDAYGRARLAYPSMEKKG
jgi:hypothetical protein